MSTMDSKPCGMDDTQFEHELTPQHAVNIFLRALLFRFVLSMAVTMLKIYM